MAIIPLLLTAGMVVQRAPTRAPTGGRAPSTPADRDLFSKLSEHADGECQSPRAGSDMYLNAHLTRAFAMLSLTPSQSAAFCRRHRPRQCPTRSGSFHPPSPRLRPKRRNRFSRACHVAVPPTMMTLRSCGIRRCVLGAAASITKMSGK